MRSRIMLAMLLSGCGGLFEVNPEYSGSSGDVADSSGDGVSTSGPSAGSSSSDGAETTNPPGASTSSTGGGDTDVPATCSDDPYEPNDGQPDTWTLGDLIADGPFEITANIETSADEDWFKMFLVPPGAVQPSPVASVASGSDLEVCVYVGCIDTTAVVDCGSQQTDTSAPSGGGNPGCCGLGSARIISYTCEGALELEGNAYARIRATAPIDACVPYVANFASE